VARSPLNSLDPALDRAILEATVRDGPAVDGVTLGQTITIDSIDCAGLKSAQDLARPLAEGCAVHRAVIP
jgi:hypothetical protein